jgi:hypothetical protein
MSRLRARAQRAEDRARRVEDQAESLAVRLEHAKEDKALLRVELEATQEMLAFQLETIRRSRPRPCPGLGGPQMPGCPGTFPDLSDL